MKRIKQILAFMVLLVPLTFFGQCPPGAIPALSTSASTIVSSGQTYCASSDIDIADLTVKYGGKFVVASGTTINASGSFNIQGELIVEDGASINLIGSMQIGFIGNEAALVRIGKGSYVSMTGSLTQYDATQTGYFPGVKNLIEMDDYSVMEVCGTYSHQSNEYRAIDFIGSENDKNAYFITKAQASGGGSNSVLTNFSQVHWIAMHSVSDILPGNSGYCGEYATPTTCADWPKGLTADINECFRAGNIIEDLPIEAAICEEPTTYDFETIASGNWGDSNIWAGGSSPGKAPMNKSILIKHNVRFDKNGSGSTDLDPKINTVIVVKGENAHLTLERNILISTNDSKLIINGGSLTTENGDIEFKNVDAAFCAIDACITAGEDFKISKGHNNYIANTGIVALGSHTSNRGRIDIGSAVGIEGNDIRLWANHELRVNNSIDYWEANTISGWFAGNGLGSSNHFSVSQLPAIQSSEWNACDNEPEFPNIDLVKTGTYIDTNNNGQIDAGDQIEYVFTITNIGNVPLTNILVSDAKLPNLPSSPIALDPEESDNTSFTALYTLTSADLNAGYVSNTATVNAKDPNNQEVSDTDSTTLTFGIDEGLDCNEFDAFAGSGFSVNNSKSGLLVQTDDWINKGRLIDGNPSNYASSGSLLSLGSKKWIEAKNENGFVSAGSYAGFIVNDFDLIGLGGSMHITTYLNGVLQEDYSANNLISTFLGNGKQRVGFITTKKFDAVRLTVNPGISVGSSIRAYAVEVLRVCDLPEIECNEQFALTQADHQNQTEGSPVVVEHARSGLSGISIGTFSNADHVVEPNPDSYMTMSVNVGVLGSASIAVRKLGEPLPQGYFAGFNISNSELLSLELLNNIQIRTYLNGQLQESTSTGASLIEVPLLTSSDRHTVGFVTTEEFDEVRLTLNQPVGISLGTTRVYHAVTKKYCEGPELDCNVNTALSSPEHPIDLAMDKIGITGVACAACEVKDPAHLIDSDATKYARINLTGGVGTSGSVAVKNGFEAYQAGTYAGFEISSDELISLNLLNNFQIKTYLDGVHQETATGATLFLAGDLFSSANRQVIGFVTNYNFDELEFVVNNTVGANLEITRVYAPVIKNYCEGPELECNTETMLSSPEYPIDLNYVRTGIEGAACVACGFDNPQNVLDGEENTFAAIFLPASVANSAGISVRNGFETYPENTYVAFEVGNTNLVNLELLGGTTIELYKDNQLVQSGTGEAQLLAGNTTIISGVNRGLIGMVSNVEFDEARFVIRNFANINVGTTNVYNMVVTKGCEGEFDCQTSTTLTAPDYSVVLESSRTGIGSGVACVGCSVNAPWKVLNEDDNDPATINLVAGAVGTSGSISVRDLSLEYPAGTTAGFVIQDPNPVLEVGLLSGIRIRTYLDGQLQESKLGAGQLIDLNAILPWLGSGSQKHAVGFVTTKPFNEIRITYTTLLQAVDFLNVYYAFADGRFAQGNGFDCNDFMPMNAVNDFNQTPQNTSVNGNVLTNDFGNGVTVKEAVYWDENGTEQVLGLSTATPIYDENGELAGEITLNQDGTYTFVPENAYTGKVPIRYTAEDENGLTDEADLVITVIPVVNPSGNNPPIAHDDNYTVNINTPVNGNVLDNDSDPDGDDLTITNIKVDGVDYPITPGSSTVVNTPEGEITIDSDGSFTFVPEDGYTGKVPPMTYTITDGEEEDTADINIKVIDTPEGKNTTYAVDDANSAPKGTAMSGNVLDNDYDLEEDHQTVTGATAHFNGTDYPLNFGQSTTIPSVGEIQLNAEGSYEFTPEADFVGTLVVDYQIKDENNTNRADYDAEAVSSATLYLTNLDTISGGYVTAKVLLQGGLIDLTNNAEYISDSLMRDDLRVKGLLPIMQPYEAIYGYEGDEEIIDMSVFDDRGNSSVVDWVLLELRDANNATDIVARKAGLLLRNGDVVGMDGTSAVFFEGYSGTYYLSVRHRNHLGVMSKEPLDLAKPVAFDFRTDELFKLNNSSESPAFYHNSYQMLWSGDGNHDGRIRYSSSNSDSGDLMIFILTHPANIFGSDSFSVEEYNSFDFNLNGEVKGSAVRSDDAVLEMNIMFNMENNIFQSDSYSNLNEHLPN